ncbi:nucleoporin Nup43-like isoform X2 [Ptychodera flava]|uniref:nucleoporin Nup43-like isoform X2 n=1 Tax=Ptychodera flava TaxID=63121 RepID=UPI003969FEFA
MADPVVKFVSQKISKIRWRPRAQQGLQASDVFASGSWDDEENKIAIWKCSESLLQVDSKEQAVEQLEPELLCETRHIGDVTDLKYIDSERLIGTSSTGTVTVYRYHENAKTLSVHNNWESVHHHPSGKSCPCTCVAVNTPDVVSVGEDGRIQVLRLDQRHPVRTIDNADSCTIHAVCYLKQYEVITVNSTGQLKIWDLRQPTSQPSRSFILSGERIPLHCIDKHPNQPHIVATGGEDGVLTIWDMRQESFPVTLLDAHSTNMWELKFHPTNPDHLFTCSEDGSVWHWDNTSSQVTMATQLSTTMIAGSGVGTGGGHFPSASKGLGFASSQAKTSISSPWLSNEATSQRNIDITTLLPHNKMPINTLDIENNCLLCGTDGEAMYIIRNLTIR